MNPEGEVTEAAVFDDGAGACPRDRVDAAVHNPRRAQRMFSPRVDHDVGIEAQLVVQLRQLLDDAGRRPDRAGTVFGAAGDEVESGDGVVDGHSGHAAHRYDTDAGELQRADGDRRRRVYRGNVGALVDQDSIAEYEGEPGIRHRTRTHGLGGPGIDEPCRGDAHLEQMCVRRLSTYAGPCAVQLVARIGEPRRHGAPAAGRLSALPIP